MELWIWLGGLLVTIASVGALYWYARHADSNNKNPKGNHHPV